MLSSQEVNCLGQIIDTTYGRSSTVASPTRSIKCSLAGEVLTVRYTTVIQLMSEHDKREQVKRSEEESVKVCDDYMRNLRKEFKESAGRALKVKQIDTSDSVEVITTSPYNPRKMAYYRRVVSFEVG